MDELFNYTAGGFAAMAAIAILFPFHTAGAVLLVASVTRLFFRK
jgi:hypothetical protein